MRIHFNNIQYSYVHIFKYEYSINALKYSNVNFTYSLHVCTRNICMIFSYTSISTSVNQYTRISD